MNLPVRETPILFFQDLKIGRAARPVKKKHGPRRLRHVRHGLSHRLNLRGPWLPLAVVAHGLAGVPPLSALCIPTGTATAVATIPDTTQGFASINFALPSPVCEYWY